MMENSDSTGSPKAAALNPRPIAQSFSTMSD